MNADRMELNTIIRNLELAQQNKDWDMVDRATQRLANKVMAM
jgi:hypothetical protein